MACSNKKMSVVNILEILYRYSDEDHRMSREDISKKLKEDYGMEVDYKTIRRNISDLIGSGYDIKYKTTLRKASSKANAIQSSDIWTDFYIDKIPFTRNEPLFDDYDMDLIIDALLTSRNIDNEKIWPMIKKLERLLNVDTGFEKCITRTGRINESDTSKRVFENLKALSETKEKIVNISFLYDENNSGEAAKCISDITDFKINVKYNYYILVHEGKEYRMEWIRDIKVTEIDWSKIFF